MLPGLTLSASLRRLLDAFGTAVWSVDAAGLAVLDLVVTHLLHVKPLGTRLI